MDETQFQQQTQGTTPMRDLNVRQVEGGFVIVGVVRYVDPNTKAVKLATQNETVAADTASAAKKASTFLTSGNFE